ncbi:Hypothetical_protein [Hexamita inflata]|uniref:Hypothetical_protein n=1 Tax=Hexamita inflata TaxID=28002 RepID=A0AA86P2X8_9EUKA|nr:Hypothetical protein HINF_LOCUS17470 [Hexamita inflata]CAI9955285.1 Hypothetical protein HINF_LOCUS42930 [Hexamita inflata]
MSITQRGQTINREYTQKLETHSTNYEVHTSQIHPIILSDQRTIHPESLKKINQFCRINKFLRSTARSIIKSHGNRTRPYYEAAKQHAEKLQLQFTYADNHDIFYEEFQNRDGDNVVISHDLSGSQLPAIQQQLNRKQIDQKDIKTKNIKRQITKKNMKRTTQNNDNEVSNE